MAPRTAQLRCGWEEAPAPPDGCSPQEGGGDPQSTKCPSPPAELWAGSSSSQPFPQNWRQTSRFAPEGLGGIPQPSNTRGEESAGGGIFKEKVGLFVNRLFPWFAEIILGRKREVKKGEGKENTFFLFAPLSPGPTRGPLPPALDLTLPLPSDPNPGSGLKHATATNPFPKGPRGTPCHKHNPRGGTACPSHNHSPLLDSPQHQPPHPNIQHSQALCYPPKTTP